MGEAFFVAKKHEVSCFKRISPISLGADGDGVPMRYKVSVGIGLSVNAALKVVTVCKSASVTPC